MHRNRLAPLEIHHAKRLPPSHTKREGESLAGFTILELLITIAILATLATLVFTYVFPALQKARDARRKFELSNIGRFVVSSCYVPSAGSGTYDFADLASELKSKYPQYANYMASLPKDPSLGTETETYYKYVVAVASSTKKCALYANLENKQEEVTIPNLDSPTAGGGVGVLAASSTGWNGSNRYYQFSN